ncbi:MAG: hypothetical protein IJW92_08860 [Clostridia bacterium]|nr:hypothetical protein [Clostridia bacterium]
MKHKCPYFGTAILSFLLCIVLAVGVVLPATAAESGAGEPLDYGIPNRESNSTMEIFELYQMLFEHEPTAAEAMYLRASELCFTYNSLVPDSRISTFYDAEAGTLEITLSPYVYTASNGETVTWVPKSATIDGTNYKLTEVDGNYVCTLEGLVYSRDFDLEVSYTWDTELPAEVAYTVQNLAYSAGMLAIAEENVYLDRLGVYNSELAKYEAWQAYQQWEKDYTDYCKAYDEYADAKQKYDAYMVLYNDYAAKLDAYEQWQAYYAYQDFLTHHIDEYNAYLTYLKQLEPVLAKLEILESAFISDSNGWQLYSSIMGSSVDMVIENKDLLVTGGFNADDIALADRATKNLRALLTEYASLRSAKYASEHAKTARLYQFYTKNYTALKTNFQDLYRTLKGFYNDVFITALRYACNGDKEKMRDKQTHYWQFVGQLYVVATCLDDSGNRDPGWSIEGRSLSAVVEAVQLLKDTNYSNPTNTAMPDEVPAVEGVEPQEKPTVDPVTVKPTAPSVVAPPPAEPTFVAKPDESKKPDEAEHPGTAPAAPVFDSVEQALMAEIKAGTLKERTVPAAPLPLHFEASTARTVSIRNLKTVTFYNYDGTVLYQTQVNYGDRIYYEIPKRGDTAEYTYRVLGWETMDGKENDLSSVTSDLSLYPLYEATKRSYTVTWILDGEPYTTRNLYGTVPTPPMSLTREDGVYYRYEFSGWDKDVGAVTGDVTYTGSILQIPKDFKVTWVVQNGAVTVETDVPYGTVPSFDGELEIASDRYRYEFLGWNRMIAPVTGDVTYVAQYQRTPLAIGGASEVQSVIHTADAITVLANQISVNVAEAASFAAEQEKDLIVLWENGVTLTLSGENVAVFADSPCARLVLQESDAESMNLGFYSAAGYRINSIAFQAVLALTATGGNDALVLSVKNGDEWGTVDSGSYLIGGDVETGVTLRRQERHTISPVANELCNVAMMTPSAVAGERISLKLTCLFGYEVSGAVVQTEDGTQIAVAEDLTFVMPDAPVTVTLTVTPIVYRVTFMVGGEVWSYAEYALGDAIVLPQDPEKEAEEGYVYTFAGWGTVPAIASGVERDLVYEAVFVKSSSNVNYDTGHNNNLLFDLILPCVIAVFVLLIVGVVALIVWRRYRRRNKRRTYEHYAAQLRSEQTPHKQRSKKVKTKAMPVLKHSVVTVKPLPSEKIATKTVAKSEAKPTVSRGALTSARTDSGKTASTRAAVSAIPAKPVTPVRPIKPIAAPDLTQESKTPTRLERVMSERLNHLNPEEVEAEQAPTAREAELQTEPISAMEAIPAFAELSEDTLAGEADAPMPKDPSLSAEPEGAIEIEVELADKAEAVTEEVLRESDSEKTE